MTKYNIKEAVRRHRAGLAAEARKKLHGLRLKDSSRRKYDVRIKVMDDMTKEAGLEELDADLMICFIDQMADAGAAGTTIAGYTAAVRDQLIGLGKFPWIDEEPFPTIVRALRAQSNPKARAAIDKNKLDELVNHILGGGSKVVTEARAVRGTEPVEVAEVVKIIFWSACRVHQVPGMLKGDVRDDGSGLGNRVIWLRKNKGARYDTKHEEEHTKYACEELVNVWREALRRRTLEAGKPNTAEEQMFTEGATDEKFIRDIVKECAQTHGWPLDIVFDGPHCLRHGGTAAVEKAVREALVMSQRMVEHYSRPNVIRSAMAKRQRE